MVYQQHLCIIRPNGRDRTVSGTMTIIFFNIIGVIILAISIGVAFGVTSLLGITAEGPWMIIAGLIASVLDAAYRIYKGGNALFHPKRGGQLCFIPVWLFGVVWTILGVVYIIRGQA